jgi:hypothetical protein
VTEVADIVTRMPSWRATTSQAVQDDLDAVVGAALDAAQSLLAKQGEFFPFGITLSDAGEMGFTGADPGLGEQPPSAAVLDALYEGTTQNRAEYRAAAFALDVLANGSDAVRVQAEHRDGGPALVVMTPYQRKGFVKKAVTYGQPTAGAGEHRVWL